MTQRWATEEIDQPWSVGEAIGVAMRAGWKRFGTIALTALGGSLVISLLGGALGGALGYALQASNVTTVLHPQKTISFGGEPPPITPAAIPWWASIAILVLSIVILLGSGAFSALLAETALAVVREVPVASGRIGRALRRAPRLAAFFILFQLATFLPTAIILVPLELMGIRSSWEILGGVSTLGCGIGFGLCFAFVPFFIADDDVSLTVAMRKSWRATKHYTGTIFLYLLALMPIGLLSLTPVLGVLATAFIILGLAYGYVRSTGRNDLPWLEPEFASRSLKTFLRITFATLALVFGGLVALVRTLPPIRGSMFSIQDMLIRVATILSGVAAVVVLLALLLPLVLDRLEGERVTSFIAARHVRSKKSGFLTVISVLSICGVAISSCALSSVISVMGGFGADLERKILGNSAHLVVDTTAGVPWTDYEPALEAIRKTPGVIGASPMVYGEVMATSNSNLGGVIVKGIDPGSVTNVIDLRANMKVGKLDYLEHPEKLVRLPPNEYIGLGPGCEPAYKTSDLPGVVSGLPDDIDPLVRQVTIDKPDRPALILGCELAKTLHVYVGEEVTLVSPLGDLGPMGIMPRTKRFRVAGIFYSGMYEYDAMNVYTLIGDAQEYFGTGDKISTIEIKVDDAERADRFTPAIIAAINRPDLRVRDWREINKNLFSALKLERIATFIILSVAILVASFCIICTLLLMVTEKGKEIAILKAIGATDGSILRIFVIEGMIIGAIGTIFGVVTGLALCAGLSWFGFRLDPEVYYIDRLPIRVDGWDFLKVALAAFGICTLATIYPAFAASRLRPVDGLRYE